MWTFNRDGEPVARNAINVTLAVDERKAGPERWGNLHPDGEPSAGVELFVSGLMGRDDGPDWDGGCGCGGGGKEAGSVRQWPVANDDYQNKATVLINRVNMS